MSALTAEPHPPAARAPLARHKFRWLGNGHQLLASQLEAITMARESVRMEMYIFTDSEIGRRYREALIDRARQGVEVWLLVDAVGSLELSGDYFDELAALPHGHMKWFNRARFATLPFRDHRKIILVDDDIALIGGANVGPVYDGDGVNEGWRDGGISVRGPVVEVLAGEFDAQFARADLQQWRVHRTGSRRNIPCGADVNALFLRPGFGHNPLRDAIRSDLKNSRDVRITCAYFLPSRRLRIQLAAATRRGAQVRLILAGKSDVPLMRLAGLSLYRGLLRRGIQIYEYQPQILHAKTFLFDDIVYVGSANLDPRSLHINWELMLRIHDRALAEKAREQFEIDLSYSKQVTLAEFSGRRTWWRRLKQKLAYWLLARLDPLLAEGKLRRWLKNHEDRRARRRARRRRPVGATDPTG
jgi:cardiolipin synthase A/B